MAGLLSLFKHTHTHVHFTTHCFIRQQVECNSSPLLVPSTHLMSDSVSEVNSSMSAAVPTKMSNSWESWSLVSSPAAGRIHFPRISSMSRIWCKARIQSLAHTEEGETPCEVGDMGGKRHRKRHSRIRCWQAHKVSYTPVNSLRSTRVFWSCNQTLKGALCSFGTNCSFTYGKINISEPV